MKKVAMPSEAQIKKWKAEFGQVHQITPNTDQPDIFCIVRHPKLEDIVMSSELGGRDKYKIGNLQLTSCWLYGDEAIKTDVELSNAAALKMGGIFKVYSSKIEYIDLTPEILQEIPKDKQERVKIQTKLRKITVEVNGVEKSAFFVKPSLEDIEKANLGNGVIEEGTIYLQECWLYGDEALRSGDDEIRFAAYLQALNLIRRFTASVEKL